MGQDWDEEGVFANSVKKADFQFVPSKLEMLNHGLRESLRGVDPKEAIKQKFGKQADSLLKAWKFAYDLHGKMYVKAAFFQGETQLRDYLASNPTVMYILSGVSVKNAFWGKKLTHYRSCPEKFRNCKVSKSLSAVDFEEWLSTLRSSFKISSGTGSLKERLKQAVARLEGGEISQNVKTAGIKRASNKTLEFEFGDNQINMDVDFTSEDFQISDVRLDSFDL